MTFRFFGRVIFISIPLIAVICFVLAGFAAWGGYNLLKQPDNDFLFIDTKSTQEANSTKTGQHKDQQNKEDSQPKEQEEQNLIHVYVVGCVNKPGMYAIKKGQLIYDAVEKAGGLTKDADKENINMAYVLNENVMLKILPAGKKREEPANNSGTAKGTGAGAEVISSAGSGGNITAPSGEKSHGKININTASAEELKTLPGIGDAKAKDIIDYRTKNGPFKSIEDIMNVPGIKEARFNSLKDKICV